MLGPINIIVVTKKKVTIFYGKGYRRRRGRETLLPFSGRGDLTHLSNRLHLKRGCETLLSFIGRHYLTIHRITCICKRGRETLLPLLDVSISHICWIACICKRRRETLLSFIGRHYLTHLPHHLHLQARTRDSPSFTGWHYLTHLPNRLHLQATTWDSPFLYWTALSHTSAKSPASASEDAILSFSFNGHSHLTHLLHRLHLQGEDARPSFPFWTESSHTSADSPASASIRKLRLYTYVV